MNRTIAIAIVVTIGVALAIVFLYRFSLRHTQQRVATTNGAFESVVARWTLERQTWYQRPFAFGQIDGVWYVFSWFHERAPHDIEPQAMLAVYAAIPETRSLVLHLVTGVQGGPAALNPLLWHEAPRGVLLMKRNDATAEAQGELAARLSDQTLDGLRSSDVLPRSATIVTRWLKTNFGADAELALAGNDVGRAEGLWLQTILPLSAGPEAAAAAVRAIGELARRVSSELAFRAN